MNKHEIKGYNQALKDVKKEIEEMSELKQINNTAYYLMMESVRGLKK